jgi:CcmD family protein
MKNLLSLMALLLLSTASRAQEEIEMADTMRSEGKIYVVIAVVLIILFGLLFYLSRLDKKIRQLEKELKK